MTGSKAAHKVVANVNSMHAAGIARAALQKLGFCFSATNNNEIIPNVDYHTPKSYTIYLFLWISKDLRVDISTCKVLTLVLLRNDTLHKAGSTRKIDKLTYAQRTPSSFDQTFRLLYISYAFR